MDKKIITNNSLETQSLGCKFAHELKAGDAVLLFGNLGAGKTTFVQGLAKGLGIKERILSPTFVLMRQYEIPHPSPLLKGEEDERKSSRPFGSAQGGQAQTIILNHIDLYRIEKPLEAKSLDLEEVVGEDNSVSVIEWADRIPNFKRQKGLPARLAAKRAGRQGYKIWFEYLDENRRKIVIEKLT